MDPSRWERISELFAEALERPPSERAAFLDAACAGDPTLRAEVDALLAAHGRASDFLEAGPPSVSLTLTAAAPELELSPGTRVGPYDVRERLGAGGMGVVYAAYHPELDRRVALKLLRPDATLGSSREELRARLLREAQAMARLSHPNVVTVYD